MKLAKYRAHCAACGRSTSPTPRGSVSIAAISPVSTPSTSWVLDSGASFHVTSDHSHLVACKPVTDGASIQIDDGTSCHITHQGSLCNSHQNMNLLSVGQVIDYNCFVRFDDSSYFI